ncbi:MAG: RNA methyltransferase [Bacteroidota bacterium]
MNKQSKSDSILTKQKLTGVKNLLSKKHREEEGKFIIEGWKSVDEAIKAGCEIETIVYDAQRVENKTLLSKFERLAKEVFPAKAKELEAISDTVTSQGIVAVLPKFARTSIMTDVLKRPSALIVLLDQINDPGNLGTIIRTCDWFGVDAVVIGKDTVELYNPKVVRATMGSLFHLPILDEAELTETIVLCRKEQCTVYSTELKNSVDLRRLSFPKKSAIIIGSESHGVSPKVSAMADKKIFIPQFGSGESLNAAIACGIILSRIKL